MTTTEFGQMVADDLQQISLNKSVQPKDELLKGMVDAYRTAPTPYLMLTDFRYGTPLGSDLEAAGCRRCFSVSRPLSRWPVTSRRVSLSGSPRSYGAVPSGRVGRRRRSRRRASGASPVPRMRWRTAACFCAPAFVLYTVFVVYPLLSALADSFWHWKGTTRGEFAGLSNFTSLFTTFPLNQQLWPAFWHTVAFFLGTMILQNTFGLLIAVLLSELPVGKRLLQTIYTVPYLVGGLVVGYLWSLLLSPSFGPVNQALKAVGLGSVARPWLGDPTTALPVVILVNAWHYIGFPILLFGAALGGYPASTPRPRGSTVPTPGNGSSRSRCRCCCPRSAWCRS